MSALVLGKTPYPVQLMAIKALLDCRLAEMATGEGKTLVVGLAAALAALLGTPVVVVTANDYLVARDRELMQPLFDQLGLSHAHIERKLETDQRREAYGKSIVYCTAKELCFDYLRDLALLGPAGAQAQQRAQRLAGISAGNQPMLRGLCMAIIDEADSVLLDEASTPLILSEAVNDPVEIAKLRFTLKLAKQLSHSSKN
jgi:preprotein translocase subunit SecA